MLCANCKTEEAVPRKGRFCSNACIDEYYCDDFRDEKEEVEEVD